MLRRKKDWLIKRQQAKLAAEDTSFKRKIARAETSIKARDSETKARRAKFEAEFGRDLPIGEEALAARSKGVGKVFSRTSDEENLGLDELT